MMENSAVIEDSLNAKLLGAKNIEPSQTLTVPPTQTHAPTQSSNLNPISSSLSPKTDIELGLTDKKTGAEQNNGKDNEEVEKLKAIIALYERSIKEYSNSIVFMGLTRGFGQKVDAGAELKAAHIFQYVKDKQQWKQGVFFEFGPSFTGAYISKFLLSLQDLLQVKCSQCAGLNQDRYKILAFGIKGSEFNPAAGKLQKNHMLISITDEGIKYSTTSWEELHKKLAANIPKPSPDKVLTFSPSTTAMPANAEKIIQKEPQQNPNPNLNLNLNPRPGFKKKFCAGSCVVQ